MGTVTDRRDVRRRPRDDNGHMSDSDEHRSVFGYVFGTTLGVIALAVTAWVGLRGRRNGGFGMPHRRDAGAVDASGNPAPVDEDLV